MRGRDAKASSVFGDSSPCDVNAFPLQWAGKRFIGQNETFSDAKI